MIGIRGGFVGFLPRGMDVQPFHQPVDTPTGTRNRLLHHVVQPRPALGLGMPHAA